MQPLHHYIRTHTRRGLHDLDATVTKTPYTPDEAAQAEAYLDGYRQALETVERWIDAWERGDVGTRFERWEGKK